MHNILQNVAQKVFTLAHTKPKIVCIKTIGMTHVNNIAQKYSKNNFLARHEIFVVHPLFTLQVIRIEITNSNSDLTNIFCLLIK